MASPDGGRAINGRRPPDVTGQIDDGSLTLGRRIGVLVVLGALGGAILLAASGGGGNHATPGVATASPQASVVVQASTPSVAPPVGIPAIRQPKDPLITSRALTLRVDVPDPGTTFDGLVVRIYRNTRQLEEAPVMTTGKVRIANVPLRRGTNKLTATLANSGGESDRSPIVTVVVDDQAPKVTVKSPRTGATLDANQVRVVGRTEPGLTVAARNATAGSNQAMTVGSTGVFAFDVPLADGRNTINLRTRDAAGNPGSSQLVIIKGNGHASARLWVSRKQIRRSALPATLAAKVTVRDAGGRLVKGAPVTFTWGPPGQMTTTHTTTTGADGVARWSVIRLAKVGTLPGDALVGVQATLPGGATVEDEFRLTIR